MTVPCQVPLSMGFSRQDDWSEFPFSSPGDLLNLGIETVSALAGRFFTAEPPRKPLHIPNFRGPLSDFRGP